MPARLQTLIQTAEDINFLIESDNGYQSGYDVSFSQSSNKSPSPIGRKFTSSTMTEPDVLNINGWIRELKHTSGGLIIVDTTDYLLRLKKTIESQKYTAAEYATITNSDGVFDNMLLREVSVRRDGQSPQEMFVSMTWESANFAGTIDTPTFSLGGLVG